MSDICRTKTKASCRHGTSRFRGEKQKASGGGVVFEMRLVQQLDNWELLIQSFLFYIH